MSFCLFREHTLGFVSVSFALSVFLVCILDCNLLAHDVLIMHAGDSRIRGLEVTVRDETVSLGCTGDVVARNLWRIYQRPESAKCVVQGLFVHSRIEVTNKQLCANLHILLLVCGCLVHTYSASVQSDIVHDLGRVICLCFRVEFYKAKPLMLAVDAIDGHVDVSYSASVEHQLMENAGRDTLMEVTDVDGCFFVLFPAHSLAHVRYLKYGNLPVTRTRG
jgi:hypothetical protein